MLVELVKEGAVIPPDRFRCGVGGLAPAAEADAARGAFSFGPRLDDDGDDKSINRAPPGAGCPKLFEAAFSRRRLRARADSEALFAGHLWSSSSSSAVRSTTAGIFRSRSSIIASLF